MSVKVKLIDERHQWFMVVLKELSAALRNKPVSPVTVEHVIDELNGYSLFHFATEEKYFDLFNYEAADEHKAIHREYINKLEEFRGAFKEGGIKIADALLKFMEEWWREHIPLHDKKYSQCFNEHGLNGV